MGVGVCVCWGGGTWGVFANNKTKQPHNNRQPGMAAAAQWLGAAPTTHPLSYPLNSPAFSGEICAPAPSCHFLFFTTRGARLGGPRQRALGVLVWGRG
jgi:hypothetical protein